MEGGREGGGWKEGVDWWFAGIWGLWGGRAPSFEVDSTGSVPQLRLVCLRNLCASQCPLHVTLQSVQVLHLK